MFLKWDLCCVGVFHGYLNEPPWYSSGRSLPSRAFWASACQTTEKFSGLTLIKRHVISFFSFSLHLCIFLTPNVHTLLFFYQQVINSSRTQCISSRSKYVLSLKHEKCARHSLDLHFRHQQQLRWYNYNHMFIYSVLHSRGHPVKKNSDKLSSLEGFYSSAVFKCKCSKCWSNQTKCRVTNKIIWGRIRDPRIHELCDFGLHKNNSQ